MFGYWKESVMSIMGLDTSGEADFWTEVVSLIRLITNHMLGILCCL